MKYDILFDLEIEGEEKNYKKYFPDKKFKLEETDNEVEEIEEDFSRREVKFIGTLNEKETKEFIEDYSGYTKVEPCLADVIGMPSYFPAVSPAIVIYDEMPYPPLLSCYIFITPVPENEGEFDTLKALSEKDDNGKALIDYITNKLLE
jgi:hypothetical protein